LSKTARLIPRAAAMKNNVDAIFAASKPFCCYSP
jgi:hypothetical protein